MAQSIKLFNNQLSDLLNAFGIGLKLAELRLGLFDGADGVMEAFNTYQVIGQQKRVKIAGLNDFGAGKGFESYISSGQIMLVTDEKVQIRPDSVSNAEIRDVRTDGILYIEIEIE